MGGTPDGAANRHVPHEQTGVRDGVVGQGQGLSEEEESRISETMVKDLRSKENGDFQPLIQQARSQPHQHQHQQPPGPIIGWERFLPVRTLKVLLVENDDCTRHVVSSLLRNCSYEVTAAANGLQAWKILEDLSSRIDLVLTEVVMPCLSGVGLLDKIMSHKTCKNIPVIMMSSNDSMGTVFKCLSKGAVDFLVKPIRKNELKNLWQHVWRRCHSSSGSGSESGIQMQKSVESESADDSDNNSDSNDDNIGTSGLNARDGSDNGSGTQSSRNKRAVEVESPQHDRLTDPPGSTCAQVIRSKPETFCKDQVPSYASKDCQEQEHADDLMGRDLEIGIPKSGEMQFESYPTEKVGCKITDKKLDIDRLPEIDSNNESDRGIESNESDEPSTQVAALIGAIAKGPDVQPVTGVIHGPNSFTKMQGGLDKTTENNLSLPSLELSLKRLRSVGEIGAAIHEEHNVLRRSDQSAFTRYYKSVASNEGRVCIQHNTRFNHGSSEAGSNSSSNINNVCSTTKNAFTNPTAYKEKTTSTSAGKCTHTSSAFHPPQHQASTQQNIQEKAEDETTATVIGHSRGTQHQLQVQYHHHHYHHHHLHIHGGMQQRQPQQQPECGSSDIFVGPIDANGANNSVNGSNSGNNHGSNGHNGSGTAVNVGELNVDIANGISDQVVIGGGNRSDGGCGSGVDQQWFSQREAALKKFRQKRKERNFGKKVRYQSRKRLAEQRPRVRGQFVRKNMREENPQKQRDDT